MLKNKKIAIIGLGYVGLPLAVEFGKKYSTIGYDVNFQRIKELSSGFDNTGEITKRKLQSAIKLSLTSNVDDIKNRVQLDMWYIKNWSFFLDIKLIFITFFTIFRGDEKAY